MSGIWTVAFTAREKADLVELPPPAEPLGPHHVEGRTLATLTSPGTELNGAYLGKNFPVYPGYAAVMEVTQAGAEVKDLHAGDRVFVAGGHHSIQRHPAAAAVPLPAGLSAERAVFARLMGVSMSTLTTTAVRPPGRVLVTGLGPVGHLAAQGFAAAGYRVTATDPVAERRHWLTTKGGVEVLERVAPDAGFDLAIECSGHEQAALDACRSVRKGGEVVLVGVPWSRRTDLHAFELLHAVFHRYVVLRSGWEWQVPLQRREFDGGSILENYAAALRWLTEGRVNVAGLYDVADPHDCQKVYQGLLHQTGSSLAVVFDWTALAPAAK
jgi:threonine dehydrogenase-like Zn-dependent dehydrogenase